MKKLQEKEEQRKKFEEETKHKVKEVLNKKPLYKQFEEKYQQEVEMPTLEQKKKQLEELRNFYKPIERQEI